MAGWKRSRPPVPAWDHLCVLSARRNSGEGSIDQQRWKTWRNAECQLARGAKASSVPETSWTRPLLVMAGALASPKQEGLARPIRQSRRQGHPAGSGLRSSLRTPRAGSLWAMDVGRVFRRQVPGTTRTPRIIGNGNEPAWCWRPWWHEAPTAWTPDRALIARTTVRLVIDNNTGSIASTRPAESSRRVVLGRVYHNDLTSACNLLLPGHSFESMVSPGVALREQNRAVGRGRFGRRACDRRGGS